MQGILRQGDVMLIPTTRQPSAKATRVSDAGRTILAYGEVTGHAHEVVPITADPDPVPAQQLFKEPDGTRLLVITRPSSLRHEEHAPLDLAPGSFEIRRQVEWTLDDVRAVAD